MNDCIIHYGMPKTGSSSIQTWLLRGLADPRFHHPTLGQRGSGNIIATSFRDHPEQHHRNRKRGLDRVQLQAEQQKIQDTFAQQLQQARGRTTIYSAELVAGFNAGEFARLCAFIGAHASKICAVGYVRSPVSFMESVFQQRVKSGAGALRMEKNYPGYRERFAKLERELGPEQVQYWHFAPADFPGGCVVQDFCARLGIQFDGKPVARANDSLSLPAIRLLYAYRKFGPGFGVGEQAMEENRQLILRLRELQGPRLRFHEQVLRPVLAQNRADIEWMEQRLGVSLDENPRTDEECVRGEQDLLHFCAQSLDWLAGQLGQPTAELAGADAAGIAQRLHQLRMQAATHGGRLKALGRGLRQGLKKITGA